MQRSRSRQERPKCQNFVLLVVSFKKIIYTNQAAKIAEWFFNFLLLLYVETSLKSVKEVFKYILIKNKQWATITSDNILGYYVLDKYVKIEKWKYWCIDI